MGMQVVMDRNEVNDSLLVGKGSLWVGKKIVTWSLGKL